MEHNSDALIGSPSDDADRIQEAVDASPELTTALAGTVVPEEDTPSTDEVSTQEFSEVERKAMEKGWKPESEFNEEDKPYVDADEYIRNGYWRDLIGDIEKKNSVSVRRLEAQVREMKVVTQQAQKSGYEQALHDLETKRNEAVEYGDTEAFSAIDNQYSKVQQDLNRVDDAITVDQQTPQATDEEVRFSERNQGWFNYQTADNRQMADQALQINQHLLQAKPYLTEGQRLELVETEIKGLYSDRFTNSKKQRPSAVVSGGQGDNVGSTSPGQKGLRDLGNYHKKLYKELTQDNPDLSIQDFLNAISTDE